MDAAALAFDWPGLASRLRGAGHAAITVLDLGCGTGASLREVFDGELHAMAGEDLAPYARKARAQEKFFTLERIIREWNGMLKEVNP